MYLGHCLCYSEIIGSFILEVLLRLLWCWINASNYWQNEGFLGNQKLSFLIWKFYWVWRHVGKTLQIIKKMADFWKKLLDSIQYWKCIDKYSWVSWTLVTWLINYKLLYFQSFTEFDVIWEEYPKLSRKWQISGKFF